jgi:hypothetical protein
MASFKDQNTQEAIDLFLGNIEDLTDENEQVLFLFRDKLSQIEKNAPLYNTINTEKIHVKTF